MIPHTVKADNKRGYVFTQPLLCFILQTIIFCFWPFIMPITDETRKARIRKPANPVTFIQSRRRTNCKRSKAYSYPFRHICRRYACESEKVSERGFYRFHFSHLYIGQPLVQTPQGPPTSSVNDNAADNSHIIAELSLFALPRPAPFRFNLPQKND